MKKFVLSIVFFVSVTCVAPQKKSNPFIKKAKNIAVKIVVPYPEQWINQCAQLLTESTHFQESLAQLQRQGIHVVTDAMNDKNMFIESLPTNDQKRLVNDLENIVRELQSLSEKITRYTKKMQLHQKEKKK